MYPEEYAEAGIEARWLEPHKAAHAYDYALQYCHPRRYGLHETRVTAVEQLCIESYPVARAWVAQRFPVTGTVQIVYSESEVVVIDAAVFVPRWHEIFCPARDDAVVLHNLSPAIFFYCHEEELEIGLRSDGG